MTKYCEECGAEILDVKNEAQLNRAILQALLLTAGAHISPKPSYCRCNEGLKPLTLGEKNPEETWRD